MSAFRPSSGGGGITAAQLEQLVSDPELAASTDAITALLNSNASLSGADRTAILAAIAEHRSLSASTAGRVESRADSLTNVVNEFRARLLEQLASILNRGNSLALQGAETRYALGDDVAAILANVKAISTAVAPSSGDMKLVNRASGLASTGYTRAGGMAVMDGFFNTIRTSLLHYTQGASTLSSYGAAYGQRATLGDKVYVTSALAFRSYNFGTGSWTSLPTLTSPGASMTPSVLGTVNNKIIEAGFNAGANTSISVYTYDPATSAHSLRASNPGGYRGFSGIADIGGAQCVFFGGKSVNENTTTTATNIVNECRIYNETTNAFTNKANLPCSMAYVRTAVRSDGKVYLAPTATSDGVTLASASRRFFLWDATTGTLELDPLPAECSTSPWLVQVLSDNRLVYVPVTAPTAGSRARLLNPALAAGAQWTSIDWDYNDLATYVALPQALEAKATTSGFAITGMTISTVGNVALTATYVATQAPSWSQSFYEIKN